ncbi:MAG: sulfotransferase family protein [Acidimicrobiia bacterium]
MERFVVGTGRCGSTLLSTMLSQHRDVVTINEFLAELDPGRRFRAGAIAGGSVAHLLGMEQRVVNEVLARGYAAPEVQYPFGTPQARYEVGGPLPAPLLSALPRLADDPDTLFDDLVSYARSLPAQPMADHYRALFAWLARYAGGSIWIERSGASIDYLADLVDCFPRARFVHIHRDGHEAALSMRAYPFFRLGMAVIFGLFPDTDEETAVRHVLETPPPVWVVGRYWSDQILHGFRALGSLDRDQYLEVRFEDLVTQPRPTLERIGNHFHLPSDPAFVERAAALVRGLPAARFPSLVAGEQEELRRECRPGQVLLGRAE